MVSFAKENSPMVYLKKINFWIASTPLLLSLIFSLFVIISSKFLPPKLPLLYSLPWGEKQLVNNQQLLIVPAIMTLVTLFNLIISWQLHPQQIFFKKILLFSSLVVTLILTITFFKIVLIFI